MTATVWRTHDYCEGKLDQVPLANDLSLEGERKLMVLPHLDGSVSSMPSLHEFQLAS